MKPGKRVVHRLRDPGDDHEADDGKGMLGLRSRSAAGEPDGERHQNAEDLPRNDQRRRLRIFQQSLGSVGSALRLCCRHGLLQGVITSSRLRPSSFQELIWLEKLHRRSPVLRGSW